MIIAQNKLYNAGHTVYTLVANYTPYLDNLFIDLTVYYLYNNSCLLWEGVSKEEGLAEFDKLTKPATVEQLRQHAQREEQRRTKYNDGLSGHYHD